MVATVNRALCALMVRERGQGTVEYVGLIMLVAVVLAGVVAATKGVGDGGIGEAIVKQLKAAITQVAAG